eukprot:scaffold6516_cov68-Skeletonema_dohrnii-CCMP3373.AAC.3
MPFTTQATADYGRTDDVGAKFRQSEKDDWKAAPARPEILDDTAFFACAADNSLSFDINDGGDNDDGCRNGCRIDGSSSSSSSSSSLSSSSSNSNGTTVVCPSSSTSVASVEASSSPSPYPSSRHDKSSTTSHAAPVNQQASALGADHSGSNSVSVPSQKEPVSWCLQDSFIDHKGWQEAKSTVEKFSKDCEYFRGDVLPGDSHARDASEIKVVVLKSFPVALERVMQKNVTKDGLENKSLDQIFGNTVTRLKEDDGYGMSHDEAVDLAFSHIAFVDAIAAVGDWDLRVNTLKKGYFEKLTEELGLRKLMSIIIIDVLKMLPNLEKIYAMGAEGFIMLDLIRSEFPDQITQEEMIMHGMQLSNGWANEDQATRYLDAIDEIAAILSGKDAKGFMNREHKEKYVTIVKDRNVRFSIRSLKNDTPLGIAQSLAMTAEWTSTDKETIRRSLKRNDGFLSVNGKLLYRLTIVSNDLAVGKTDEGVTEFHRRRKEVYGTNSRAREQEVISILSVEDSTPLGTTYSLAKAAEWTGVSQPTFQRSLERNDGYLTLRNVQLYRISKGKVEVKDDDDDDEVSFGMTVAGAAAFERRKQEVNAAKVKGYRICSSDGNIVYGIARTLPEGAEWTGVGETTFRARLNSEDRILNVKGGARYQLSNCEVEATDEVSFGMTEDGKAHFNRKNEVRKNGVKGYRICSSDGNIVYGIARTIPEGAEWTGVCVSTFSTRLNSKDRIMNVKGGARYQLSKVTDDEVSFGMTEEGKAQLKRREQEVKKQKSKKKRSFNTLDPSAILDTD